MAKEVKWGKFGYKADAQKCYDEIYGDGKESTSPQEVVSLAENPDSELHKIFEWDDSIASQKYRIYQARLLLANFEIVVNKEEPKKIRAVFASGITKETYKPTEIIMSHRDEREALLDRAKNEARSYKQRYQMLTELAPIFEAIDSII